MLGAGRFPCNISRTIRRYPALRSIDREFTRLQRLRRGKVVRRAAVMHLHGRATIVTRSYAVTWLTVSYELPHDPVHGAIDYRPSVGGGEGALRLCGRCSQDVGGRARIERHSGCDWGRH